MLAMDLVMSDDFWEEPHIKRWAESVMNDTLPKMESSHSAVTLWTGKPDAKIMVETGAAVLLDKPIILAVFNRFEIPNKLRRVADEIVELPDGVNVDGADAIRDALMRLKARGLL